MRAIDLMFPLKNLLQLEIDFPGCDSKQVTEFVVTFSPEFDSGIECREQFRCNLRWLSEGLE